MLSYICTECKSLTCTCISTCKVYNNEDNDIISNSDIDTQTLHSKTINAENIDINTNCSQNLSTQNTNTNMKSHVHVNDNNSKSENPTTVKMNCSDLNDTNNNRETHVDVHDNICKNDQSGVIPMNGFGLDGQHFSITCLNIQHLLNKHDEIKALLCNKHAPNIFGICETFLTDDTLNEQIAIHNYAFERKDRKDKKGGGLLIYIQSNLRYVRRYDIETTNIETIWLEIFYESNSSFLVNFTYRPPNSIQSWIDSYEEQLDIADCVNKDIYLLGDFNINFCQINGSDSFNNTKWTDMVSKFYLKQLIKSPTRVTKQSSSIIDHIYCTNADLVHSAFVSKLAISDHFPVCCTLVKSNNRKRGIHKSIKYRSFKHFDENFFRNDLILSGLEHVEMYTDPNSALNVFYNCINNVINKHAPIKEKRIKHDHQPEWLTHEIKICMRDRDYHKQKGNFNTYKVLRNKTAALIKRSKRDFFNKAIKENKEAKFIWKNLKDIAGLHKKSNTVMPKSVKTNGEELHDMINIANELNRHFVNISTIITKTKFYESSFTDLKHKLDYILQNRSFDIKYITPLEVKTIIDRLNVNKSTGIDNIGPKIIKHCGDIITTSIAAIINSSISQGIFPDNLKEARVVPIFKTGDRDDVGNYRPISILPTLSKIFERHIAEQIHQYFKETNIIHKTQSGFRKNHSCHTALTRLIDNWIKEIDSGKLIGAVFLDLRKAFDLVDHEILIHKLKLYHFSDRSINLFKSYLTNRKQSVIINNIYSEKLSMQSGVPQGSILGPLLFLIYINDICYSCENLNIDLYADDSTIFESDFKLLTIQRKLQNNINQILKWCTLNNMALHPNKTKCMILGSKQRVKSIEELSLQINDTFIENVIVQKILGVFIDNTLSWQTHIDFVCRRVNTKITLLKRIIYYIDEDTKKLFYNIYILPIFDYCCTIWSNGPQKSTKKISQLQKRAAKIILNKPLKTPSDQLYKALNWLTFEERCKYHFGVLVFKSIHNMAPTYITEILTFSSNENYNLRSTQNRDLVCKFKPRTNLLKSSFSYTSMNIWNRIPQEVRDSRTINTFKNRYKNHLLQGRNS